VKSSNWQGWEVIQFGSFPPHMSDDAEFQMMTKTFEVIGKARGACRMFMMM
jgi:hypothetical protein